MQTQVDYGAVEALAARARTARSLAALGFSIANDTHALLAFRQALVFQASGRLLTISGLAQVGDDSPYQLWLKRIWPWLNQQFSASSGWLEFSDKHQLPADCAEGWTEWWPDGVYYLHLSSRDGVSLGWVVLLLDHKPAQQIQETLLLIAQHWSYTWEVLNPPSRKGVGVGLDLWGKLRYLLVLLALTALWIPVPQSALAPAEVISLDSQILPAPLDGVVKDIHVRPNQAVKAGDKLFSLDDTTLRNRLEVVQKGIQVAQAELLAATQKAFDVQQSKAELALLMGRVQERKAELVAVEAQLARIHVFAPMDGVVVFGDPDDWLGKPVLTGEKIMMLANPHPQQLGILIHLPVADAVSLGVGAPVRLFLTVQPLSPLSGHVKETSYQALMSPDNVASYRLRAVFEAVPPDSALRIGLKGTAKIQGETVALGYFLFRRPLATLREWSGL
jgi:hypothetical protein